MSINSKTDILYTTEACPKCNRYVGYFEIGKLAVCILCGHKWELSTPWAIDVIFNRKCQKFADDIYHHIWNCNTVMRNLGALDKDRAIDVRLELSTGLPLDIQEKFRRPKYRHYWQFTTEYKNNPQNNEPGEFYKLSANYYFYSYSFDDIGKSGFTDWWLLDINKFKDMYQEGILIPDETRVNKIRSHASFLCFSWDKLERLDGIIKSQNHLC